MNLYIATVIVTYNRKHLLKKCLEAVAMQTYKPAKVFIVDNASTDGSRKSVEEWGYCNSCVNGIDFKYILLPENLGGAGGFYEGMRLAHESKQFDAIWVMDDDGAPDSNCLELLVAELGHHHYIAPRVVDIETRDSLAFDFGGSYNIVDENKHAIGNIIYNRACPFNGILFSTILVDKVGYPKKELFIWGDEKDYTNRCRKVGAIPITVTTAIHYHPKNKYIFEKTWLGNYAYVPQKWKAYCMYRNYIYNFGLTLGKKAFRGFYYRYLLLNLIFLVFVKHNFAMTRVLCQAVKDGKKGIWGGEKRYMNFNNNIE